MSVTFNIRPAGYADIPDIIKVNNETWNICYRNCIPEEILIERNKTLAERIAKWQAGWQNKIGFVAVSDGKIIGETTGITQKEAPEFDCLLNTLYVLPSYQGSGIGKALFNRFAEEMKSHNCHNMEIHTLYKGIPDKNGISHEGPSLGFYRKMGCTQTNRFDTHPLGMTDVLFFKKL